LTFARTASIPADPGREDEVPGTAYKSAKTPAQKAGRAAGGLSGVSRTQTHAVPMPQQTCTQMPTVPGRNKSRFLNTPVWKKATRKGVPHPGSLLILDASARDVRSAVRPLEQPGQAFGIDAMLPAAPVPQVGPPLQSRVGSDGPLSKRARRRTTCRDAPVSRTSHGCCYRASAVPRSRQCAQMPIRQIVNPERQTCGKSPQETDQPRD